MPRAIVSASLACCAVVLLASCAGLEPATGQPPNILFLFADDLRCDAVGAFGGRGASTQNLDALAARGTALTQVYCMGSRHGAVCVPSRAMVLSGRALARAPDNLAGCVLLPELLRSAGYETFMTGKWHNGDAALRRAFPDARAVFRGGMADHFRVPLVDLVRGEVANRRTGDKHSSELFADAAVDFLRARSRSATAAPFFAYVPFMAPHDPRDPPPAWLERERARPRPELPPNFRGQHGLDLGAPTMTVRDENLLGWPRDPELLREQITEYRALVAHLDEQIGRILDALAANGLAERTLVVFASDHGLALGSHGLLGKQSLYEHSMNAPVVLAGPGVPAGERRDGLAYLFDLMPTMAAAAGAAPPPGDDGRDLMPLVRGADHGRSAVLLAYADTQRAIRVGDLKLIRLPAIDRTLLFDLRADPEELVDLADVPAHRGSRERLEERLRAEQRRMGDDLAWTAPHVQPSTTDLTGKRSPPDQWQPGWIRDKYFR